MGFILLGSAIYILRGIAKFQKDKKGRSWTIRDWARLNGINTAIGLLTAFAAYFVAHTKGAGISYEMCLLLGLALDMAASLINLGGPKK